MLFLWGQAAANRARIMMIRDEAPTAVEALARMFTDAGITDDGTVGGRLHALLNATEHRFVPGLHTGADIGMTGFRKEYEDPWPTSTDQVGHFLTAVRLGFDPRFVSNPIFRLLLGGGGDADAPLRLIIGHEKVADPPDINRTSPRTLLTALRRFREQYQSATEDDIAQFRDGHLDLIRVGDGLGNSMEDLRLSHKGWLFGRSITEGRFKSREEVAGWIRTEIGTG
jgi:hypothetical protein